MALKGTLTGLNEPQGECSDKNGNVWVTNTNANQIVLLSRSGSVIGSLSDPDGYPVGCAINPTNGDLAVTDIFDFSEAGGVLIYHNGSGSPTRISNPAQYEYFFDGYDSNGNLYVDGFSYPSFTFTISVLPAGSSSTDHRQHQRHAAALPGHGPVVSRRQLPRRWRPGRFCGVLVQRLGYEPDVHGRNEPIVG